MKSCALHEDSKRDSYARAGASSFLSCVPNKYDTSHYKPLSIKMNYQIPRMSLCLPFGRSETYFPSRLQITDYTA